MLLFEQNFALENYCIYQRKLVKLKTDLFILLKNISKIFRGIFRTLANIYDEVFCKNVQQYYALNYISKKAPSLMLEWVLNRPAISIYIYRQYVVAVVSWYNSLSWLATCARKPKVPGLSTAPSYVQTWAPCSNRPANV